MAFVIEMNIANVGTINSHAQAVAFYDKCRVGRTKEHGEERRIKGKERNKDMGVRIDSTGNVLFRYYRTDVVVWLQDDSYVINTYSSRSTDAFATAFMGADTYLTKQGSQIAVGRYYDEDSVVYPIMSWARVHGKVVTTNAVFTQQVINRKAAKAVLATTRYTEYRKWHAAMRPMLQDHDVSYWKREYFHRDTLVEALPDSDKWHRIMMSQTGHPDMIRQAIYDSRATGGGNGVVYDTVTKDTLTRAQAARGWDVSLHGG